MPQPTSLMIEPDSLDLLFAALRDQQYDVFGPTVRDAAIVYDAVDSVENLPRGVTDTQAAGHYRLSQRDDDALFGFNVGPHSWKKYLFPAEQTLWHGVREGRSFVASDAQPAPRNALVGVRACELAAIGVQDRVFAGGEYQDSDYTRRRERSFIIAVNCSTAGDNCFCTSMQTGPAVTAGYDILITELIDGARHELLLQSGTDAGVKIMAGLQGRAVAEGDWQAARRVSDNTRDTISRRLDTSGIESLLPRNADHPRWQETAGRCVSCGNCTSVCPTCFCSDVSDTTSLDGNEATRQRHWASCFSPSFTHVAGSGSTRQSTASRYRHWLTHKLSSWHEQFGESGCVGCGRCITWCPPGIDLIEEVDAIRKRDGEVATPVDVIANDGAGP